MLSLVPSLSSMGADRAVAEAIGGHMDAAFRSLTGDPALLRTTGYVRLMTGEPHPLGNFVLLADGTDLAQARVGVEPLIHGGAPAAAILPGLACSPEVHAYLLDHGFTAHEPLPAMAVEIVTLDPTGLPDGYELIRVNHAPEARAWTEAFAVGYELPLRVARAMSPETIEVSPSADAPLQFFAIRRAGRIVGTSMIVLHGGLAGVYCVATVPEERGKGIGAHATAEALRRVAPLGYGVGVLQSSQAGHSIYRRLGFADYGGVPIYIRIPD
jgi:ribosomal protein S18 acetylase RimI-like enzyme